MAQTTPTGEQTRERILDAALPLFAALGFAGTSVRRVGAAAGVNVATLAYHFEDKDGLYQACIERIYEELSRLTADDLVGDTDDAVEALVLHAWAFVRPRRDEVRLLHRHLLDRGRHHEVLTHRWFEPLMAQAEAALQVLHPGGTVTERRVVIYSVLHLLVRFALEDPEDLARQLAVTGSVDDAITDALTRVVRTLLAGA